MGFKEAEFEDVEWTNKTQGKEKVKNDNESSNSPISVDFIVLLLRLYASEIELLCLHLVPDGSTAWSVSERKNRD